MLCPSRAAPLTQAEREAELCDDERVPQARAGTAAGRGALAERIADVPARRHPGGERTGEETGRCANSAGLGAPLLPLSSVPVGLVGRTLD